MAIKVQNTTFDGRCTGPSQDYFPGVAKWQQLYMPCFEAYDRVSDSQFATFKWLICVSRTDGQMKYWDFKNDAIKTANVTDIIPVDSLPTVTTAERGVVYKTADGLFTVANQSKDIVLSVKHQGLVDYSEPFNSYMQLFSICAQDGSSVLVFDLNQDDYTTTQIKNEILMTYAMSSPNFMAMEAGDYQISYNLGYLQEFATTLAWTVTPRTITGFRTEIIGRENSAKIVWTADHRPSWTQIIATHPELGLEERVSDVTVRDTVDWSRLKGFIVDDSGKHMDYVRASQPIQETCYYYEKENTGTLELALRDPEGNSTIYTVKFNDTFDSLVNNNPSLFGWSEGYLHELQFGSKCYSTNTGTAVPIAETDKAIHLADGLECIAENVYTMLCKYD